MKITLSKSGGFIPINKSATAEVDWSDKNAEEIIAAAGVDENSNTNVRDAVYHDLEINDKTVAIDLNKIPAAYKPVFDSLLSNMKISK